MPYFSLPVVLTIIFVILKLTKHINWSWVWVFSPLWISFVLGVLFWLLVLVSCSAILSGLRF